MSIAVNLKQQENESLQDYSQQLRVASDVFVSHSGVESPFEYMRFMQGMNGFTASDPIAVKNTYQQF
jgi:hypothetical protein